MDNMVIQSAATMSTVPSPGVMVVMKPSATYSTVPSSLMSSTRTYMPVLTAPAGPELHRVQESDMRFSPWTRQSLRSVMEMSPLLFSARFTTASPPCACRYVASIH